MLDVEDDQRGRDDAADLPGADADAAQGLERGLEQRVSTFTQAPPPEHGNPAVPQRHAAAPQHTTRDRPGTPRRSAGRDYL